MGIRSPALDAEGCTRLKNGMVDFLTSLPLSDAQQIVQKTFDAVASSYDNAIVRLVESLSCPWSTYTAKLEAFMANAAGKVILDVGCGTAFPVGSFVPQTSIYLGMDISLEMLGHAKGAPRGKPQRRALEHRRGARSRFPTTASISALPS